MSQHIEIENGLVTVVERSVGYSVPLKDWLSKIEKRNPLFTPTLPLGTRAVYWDQTDLTNQKFVVLIEQQPQIIHMNFYGAVHTLSIPYTRFFFYCHTSDPTQSLAWRLADYRVFWSNAQYNDPAATDMIPALVPNVYPDGRICFGSTGADAQQSLAQRLNQTANEFYVSNFNRDLAIRRPNQQRGYRQWERMTQKDPSAWIKWNDWDRSANPGSHHWTGVNQLIADNVPVQRVLDARLDPVVSADPIPPVPMGATFGRIEEWLADMDNNQRARLLASMLRDRALNNERYEELPEFDDDEVDA